MRSRVLFVNSGILGMLSFSKYVREAMAIASDIEASHITLSEDLTIGERVVRRTLCARAWRDGWLGVRNADLARFRRELHAGLQAARRIRRLLPAWQPDVVHFHRQATAYDSVPLMRRIPSIVSIDATQDIMIESATTALERWSYAPNAAADGRVFHAAAAIVSTSEWAAGHLRRRYPGCRAPIHVMPPPIRTQFFDPAWIDERFARAAAPGYRPRVLFVGGDFVRKGGVDLLAAWREARLFERADLDVVTDWPMSSVDLPGVRILRGIASYSTEWSELWRRADLFVFPTHHEAFGTVLQEAGAAGLPRISTRMWAVPETVVDGANGVLIDPHDRCALALALRALLESAGRRRAYGLHGRTHVLRRASADAYSAALRRLIHEVAMTRGVAA